MLDNTKIIELQDCNHNEGTDEVRTVAENIAEKKQQFK